MRPKGALVTSPLQLDAYYVDELSYHTVDDFDDTGEGPRAQLEVEASHYTREDDPLAHQLVLKISTPPWGEDGPTEPYDMRIAGRAFFRILDESLSEESRSKLIVLNGSVMLLGLLRAHVSQATALGRYGPMLLQPVNLYDAYERGLLEAAVRGAEDRTA